MASNKNVKFPHAMSPKGNKIIFRATEFDPTTDISIVPLSEKAVQEYKGFQYTIFMNNSYVKGSEFSKNVYIAVDKIPLIRNPMFGFSEKTTFYSGPEDPKRLAYTISIKEDDPNCVSLKRIFELLDDYFQSDDFKNTCFKPFGYNEETKDSFDFDYNPIYRPPLTEKEIARQGENKKPFSEYGSVKIKFDVTTMDFKTKETFEHPKINTMIFKIDEATKKPKKCVVNSVSDVENLVHKNGVINFIIRLQKCYCSKPAKKKKTKITYGFSPVFEQITIHNPGDAFSTGGHNYIDMGDGELEEGEIVVESKTNETNTINPTIPGKSGSKSAGKSAAKPKPNSKASKKITDEPDGEVDEDEHISDDDDVQAPPTDESEEGDEDEKPEDEDDEGGEDEGDGDDEVQEEQQEEEPEPPKKNPVEKKKIVSKNKK